MKILNGTVENARAAALMSDKMPAIDSQESMVGTAIPTAEQRDSFEERAAIMEYDEGLCRDQAEEYAYGCVKPLPLFYAEPCGQQTPPKGACRNYLPKLYKPTMDLQPWCLKQQKWCYEVKIAGDVYET